MALGGHLKQGQRQPSVRLYDFRRPDKFSKEQTRTLELLHENFARQLTTILSTHMRTMVEVVLLDIRQMTFDEYMAPLSEPAIMGVFGMAPLEGNAVMDIDPKIAFPMVDRLFGGPGHIFEERRALTELEQVVLQRVLTGALSGLGVAWEQVAAIKPELVSMESNPLFVQVVPPNEMVVAVRFSTQVGQQQGHWNLCLPYLLLEPILPRLSAHQWFAREPEQSRRRELAQQVQGVDVEVRVELGRATLSLQQLLALEVGDVVQVEQPEPSLVTVFVEDRPYYRGRAGRVADKLGVEFVRKLGREEAAGDE